MCKPLVVFAYLLAAGAGPALTGAGLSDPAAVRPVGLGLFNPETL